MTGLGAFIDTQPISIAFTLAFRFDAEMPRFREFIEGAT
jgi:hypothetical protein